MARHTLATTLLILASSPGTILPTVTANHDTDGEYGWYPDWSGRTGTCLHGDNPPTLFKKQEGYFRDTLEACCAQYYGWDEAGCLGTSPVANITGTNKYYPDYNNSPNKCAKDCNTAGDAACGGILGQWGNPSTYDNADQCCAAHYSSLEQHYCVAISNGQTWAGTNEYYVDSSESICVQDCDGAAPCGGIVTQSWVTLYDTIENCCAGKLPGLDADFCLTQTTPENDATNKWFVKDGICKKDCVGTGDECARATSTSRLSDTAAICCDTGLNWADPNWCKSRSDPDEYGKLGKYTDMWFVDYTKNNGLCVKDCATSTANPACGDYGTSGSKDLYADAATCCSTRLNWQDSDTCKADSEAGGASSSTGTLKWYADYDAKHCVMDCPKGSTNAACNGKRATGTSIYDTVEDCCKAKFGWCHQDLCKVQSEAGVGGVGSTANWYPDYQASSCVQDCPVGSGDSCKGNPKECSAPMYKDADSCCDTKFGWSSDVCKSKSANGGALPTTGTNKWYVSGDKCAKDCAGSDGGCDGIVGATGKWTGTMYDSADDCCKGGFSWMGKNKLCKAMSEDTGPNGQFFPDMSDSTCKQWCSGAAPCTTSIPSDKAIPMYDSIDTCCSTSIGWATEASCKGLSAAEQSTDQYYVGGTGAQQCVRNCESGHAGCGGIAKSWNTLYANAAACCASSAVAWMDREDCEKGYGSPTPPTPPTPTPPTPTPPTPTPPTPTTATPPPTLADLTKWYVGGSNAQQCVMNCDSGNVACGGRRAGTWVTLYPNAAACCASSAVAWMDREDCEKGFRR